MFRLTLFIGVFLGAVLPPRAAAQFNTRLAAETLAEFDKYQTEVDQEWNLQIGGQRAFQWIQSQTEKAQAVRNGKVVTHAFTGKDGLSVKSGLIHDWVGAVFLPGQKLEGVRDFLLDTSRHTAAYPELRSAATLSRNGDRSVTRLRIVKKKIITAVLDIEYENNWRQPAPGKWAFAARSRKVQEVADSGTSKERMLPADTGHGFVWRMNSQWLLRQEPEGVMAELRVVSLSRDTPRGLGWIIRPLIRDFPAEGITSTLENTRRGVGR
jgi:hypothetical protein